MKIALANITGNIPFVCFIVGGIYLIEHGFLGTGLFLLIMSSFSRVCYRKSNSKEDDEHEVEE